MIIGQREAFRPYTDRETFEKIVEFPTVSEMWEARLAEYGDRVAVEDGNEAYTYKRLENDAAGFRTLIAGKGVEKQGRVGIFSENSYDFIKAYMAAVTGGYTAVIIPPRFEKEELAECLRSMEIDLLVYDSALESRIEGIGKETGKPVLQIGSVSDIKTGIYKGKAEDPCTVIFTGGTTGKSKGALLCQEAVMQGTVNSCYCVKNVFGKRYLLILPLSHVFGLVENLLGCLYTGSSLYICRNSRDMFRDAARFKPTIAVLVPGLAELALAMSKRFHRNMFGEDMKCILCGAAYVAPYIVEGYAEMGVTVHKGYGMTETACLVAGNPISLEKKMSVGLPYPNQTLRIVDGELQIRGKNLFDRYIGAEEGENENAFTGDGFFKTGDLAEFDEDGYLCLLGRKKEVILRSNGENVSPQEVEKHFAQLPYIKDVQVFADLNENKKEILALEVTLRESELPPMAKEEVGAFVKSGLWRINEALPSFWQVSRIEIRDTDFERTAAMKIKRYHKI